MTMVSAEQRPRPKRRWWRREGVQGYLYISPWLLGFLMFGVAPLIAAFLTSLSKANVFRTIRFVGMDNYEKILTDDPVFATIAGNMLIYVIGSTVISIGLGLALALLLYKDFRGNHVFRTLIYVPSLLVGIATAYLFKQVFRGGEVGLANMFLSIFGTEPVNWLGDSEKPWLALVALILVNVWFAGGTMLIFLAGLKGIPASYFEAARVDGAGPWQMFRKVTLPLLSPVIVFNTVMALIGHIQVFETPLAFANSGGVATGNPLGYENSLGTFVTYLYVKGFVYQDMGYASALAFIMFAATLVLTGLVLWLARRFTAYGDADQN
ncbi:carbohydrate ABC transporter permease [Catellatospora vulcania]|uniref:carbohydrate ABC transporter permease n=1 Tax=Catellatospora vulcania TaxID=1460450 RepID=UPI0012D478CB|nr:sugar ABC transporter permease [Catellatospora vulcania]